MYHPHVDGPGKASNKTDRFCLSYFFKLRISCPPWRKLRSSVFVSSFQEHMTNILSAFLGEIQSQVSRMYLVVVVFFLPVIRSVIYHVTNMGTVIHVIKRIMKNTNN